MEEGRTLTQYTLTFTMPIENINIQINVEAIEVEYKVVFRYQDVNLTNEGGQIIYDSSLEQETTDNALTNSEITREDLGFTNQDGTWTIESPREGFRYSSSSFDSNQIFVNGNGSTVIYINFIRNTYQFYLNVDLGAYSGGIAEEPVVSIQGTVKTADITTRTWSVAYGQEVVVTFVVSDGYHLESSSVEGTSEYTLPDADNYTLTLTVEASNVQATIDIDPSETRFNVRYYLQNVDTENFTETDPDNYTLLSWLVQPTSLTGERLDRQDIQEMFIDEITSLDGYEEVAERFEGFDLTNWWFNGSYQATTGETITTGVNVALTVMANGSTTINIYVNRQVIEVDIELDNSNRIDNDTVEGRDEYLYGDVVNVSFSTKPGYLFDYLRINGVTEIREDTEGANISVVYNEGTNTETVTYEFTIVNDVLGDGGNILIELFSLVGTADYSIYIYNQVIVQNIGQPQVEVVFGEPEEILIEDAETDSVIDYSDYIVADAGYYYDQHRTVADSTVNGNGSSVVRIYFMLEKYTFTVYFDEGIITEDNRDATDDQVTRIYSNYNSLTRIDDGSGLVKYEVYYTDLVGFEIYTEYGFVPTGITLRVGEGDFVEEDNSTSLDYRLVVPASDFEIEITAERVPITISYYPNFGDNEPVLVGSVFGETILLRENTFVRDGYNFLGWATSEENALAGIVEYENGAEYTITTTDNVNFYAVWEEIPSMAWWIWLIIGLALLLIIIAIIIIIVVVKKKKEKDKIRSR